MGYATFAQLVAQSSLIDGVVVAVTARRSAFLEGDLAKLKELKKNSRKPVFMWTYTLPADRDVEILNEAGYPLFTSALGCARTMRAMAGYRALRERTLKNPRVVSAPHPASAKVHATLAAAGSTMMSEWHARALLGATALAATRARLPARPPRRNGHQDHRPPGRPESPVGRYSS